MSHALLDDPEIKEKWSDLGDAIIEDVKWVVKNVIPAGITFLAGPPKSQKTTVELALALLVAGYKHQVLPPEMSDATEQGRVLVMCPEHTAGELRDMAETGMKVKVLNNETIFVSINPWEWRLDDPDGMERLMRWLKILSPKMFLLDPLVDFHSLEEKDAGGMNRLLRPLQRWAKENGVAFLVVHHTAKKSGNDSPIYTANNMRGSSALFGMADAVIMLTPQEDENTIHVEAVIKRARGWKRDIRLNVWGQKPDGQVPKPRKDSNSEMRIFLRAFARGKRTFKSFKEDGFTEAKAQKLWVEAQKQGFVKRSLKDNKLCLTGKGKKYVESDEN